MGTLMILQSVTSENAHVFGLSDQLGRIKKGLLADIIAVRGDPATNISDLRKVEFVMKGGSIFKE